MKKVFFIVLLSFATAGFASNLTEALKQIESKWAVAYYGTPKDHQAAAYESLLNEIAALTQQQPNNPEIVFWQAVVEASYADHQNPIAALKAINDVRDLLTQVIAMNPKVMNGSAYVMLGTLYYRVPAWPIGYGDKEQANKLLQTALSMNPNSIDANYYYGEFLLSTNKITEAEQYFQHALAAPVRPEQSYADSQLKERVKLALKNTQEQKANHAKNSSAIPSFRQFG